MTETSVHPSPPSAPSGAGRTATFEALRVSAYRWLFVSGMLGFLAVQSQMIARGWLARELTGTNAGLGGVFLAFGIPMLLATPWGGVAADRLSKRSVLIGAQAALALSGFWIGLAIAMGFVAYWMLLAASAIQAVAFSFLGPARMAFTGELVGRQMLPNAIVLGQMSLNATRIVGPSLAGVLIGVSWFGTAGVYFLTAGISLLALFVAATLPPGRPSLDRPQRSPGNELVDGLTYVRENRQVLLLVATSFAVVMVAFPYMAFLPTVADETFDVGAGGYGVMSAVSAIGALGVSLFIAGRASGPNVWRLQGAAGIAFAGLIALLGVMPSYPLALLAIFAIGAAGSAFQSLNNTLVLSLSPLEYHGRIQSLMMLSFSGFGMAALPLGILADAIGVRATLVVMGALAGASMTIYLRVRGRQVAAAAVLG